MSVIGVKSSAKAGSAALNGLVCPGFADQRGLDACDARFGMPAMPPKAMRASATLPSETVMLKQPQTAEIS